MKEQGDQKTYFLLLMMFFISSFAFSQKTEIHSGINESSLDQKVNLIESSPLRMSSGSSSNVNFILWFMGTKEDVNSTKSNEKNYSKKSIITSGREPNHLLLKTLLKKAINIESC